MHYFSSHIHTQLLAFQNSQLHFESHRNGGEGEWQPHLFLAPTLPRFDLHPTGAEILE